MRIWKADRTTKLENKEAAKAIFKGLLISEDFFAANEFASEIGIEAEAKPKLFLNGGLKIQLATSKKHISVGESNVKKT